ncbi:hypothetical protein [Lihuaxuella thermophila]|uniref:Carboxypeptidase regulatory-like domain-containing protein n=1 Tax=Lihuaxuella thermophila TaxID=1173111 RepID=A0A1H8BDN5_9BACL|nr:hypothetical protein [Lihuaxuella thermophila]SEM80922.1 hypothetical protein SAMN05444955_102132 [Lihuaxuella thermophila]
MKKWFKLFVAAALMFSFSFSIDAPAYAEKKSTISGRVTTTIEFDKEHAEKAKKWMGDSIERMKEDLNARLKDASKEEAKKIRKALKELEKTKVEDRFDTHPDGSADLKTPLPFIEIQVGDKRTTTDKHGKYVLSGLAPGKYKMILSRNGSTVRELEIIVENGHPKMDIDIQLFDKQFIANAKRMSRSMASRSTSDDTVHAQGNKTYPPLEKGTVVGYGDGAMKILTDPRTEIANIVGCNEADEGVTLPPPGQKEPDPNQKDPNDDTEDFPFNSSDCSRSIALGMSAATNPFLSWFYGNSINCYIESIQSGMRAIGDGTTNVYCNWTKKEDGHWNCSWFNGIEHPEYLHTHE